MTSNNEVNALASLHYHEHFGREEAYQLPIGKKQHHHGLAPAHFVGRFLFSEKISFNFLMEQVNLGGTFQTFELTESFSYEALQAKYNKEAIPLFLVNGQKQLLIFTTNWQPVVKAGCKIVVLLPVGAERRAEETGVVGEMPALSPI
jgi:hypothetical protein